jgi:hypothetical protein
MPDFELWPHTGATNEISEGSQDRAPVPERDQELLNALLEERYVRLNLASRIGSDPAPEETFDWQVRGPLESAKLSPAGRATMLRQEGRDSYPFTPTSPFRYR